MVMQLLSKMWKAKKTLPEDHDDDDDKAGMDDLANSLLFDLTFDDDREEAPKGTQKSYGKTGVKSTPGASLKPQRKAKK
jgi:hypothetical protein